MGNGRGSLANSPLSYANGHPQMQAADSHEILLLRHLLDKSETHGHVLGEIKASLATGSAFHGQVRQHMEDVTRRLVVVEAAVHRPADEMGRLELWLKSISPFAIPLVVLALTGSLEKAVEALITAAG